MSIINLQALDKMISGDGELLADISIMFAKELPQIRARLSYGIENREFGEIESVAHQLRGRVGYFGASGLQEIARRLESAARGSEMEKFPELRKEILDGVEQLLDELRGMTGLELEIETE